MTTAKNCRGVTLIELMVTVVVLVVLIMIAAPAFQRMIERKRLEGAVENLYADMQYARTESIKRNKAVYLSFNEGADWCYGLDDTAYCNCSTANDCQIDGVEKVRSSADHLGISLISTFTPDQVKFDPVRGMVNEQGSGQFTSVNGMKANVKVSWLRVLICSPSGAGQIMSYKDC